MSNTYKHQVLFDITIAYINDGRSTPEGCAALGDATRLGLPEEDQKEFFTRIHKKAAEDILANFEEMLEEVSE